MASTTFCGSPGLLAGLRLEIVAGLAGQVSLYSASSFAASLPGAAEEIGAERAGSTIGDVDAEGFHFGGEGLR